MSRRPRNRTLVGLDIEPGAIAVAKVAVNGALTVEQAATAELEPHVIRDGEVTDADALTEAIRDVWRENKGFDKRVRIGVANARIVVRVMEAPPIDDPKELAAAVRFQAQDELPMPLDAAVLDFQPLDLVETPNGPRRRVLLVAARRDMVERVLTAARSAGLRPEGIDLSAFAMVRALYRPDTGSALFLSVGGLTNLAVVAENGSCLFTRVAGGGLEALAVDLAERRGLTLEHARGWLRHVGLAAALEELEGETDIVEEARGVLVDGVRRIAQEVRASLDFHHTTSGGVGLVERVVLTGPALDVPGFGEALATELGMPVEGRKVLGASTDALDGIDASRLTIAAGLAVEEVAA
jgi:type IV pilus assembly protein PilM